MAAPVKGRLGAFVTTAGATARVVVVRAMLVGRTAMVVDVVEVDVVEVDVVEVDVVVVVRNV